MKKWCACLIPVLMAMLLVASCSLPPDTPVTREELMRSRIYNYYKIKESPEQVLNALNLNGEAVLKAKRNIRGKNYPVYIKLLATSGGIETVVYDR